MEITISMLLIAFVYLISLFFITFWLITYFTKGIEEKQNKLENYPKVTIAIPALNEEKSIRGTIESALNLDYPKEKLEIIVINDGSTDNTKNIIKTMMKNESRIKLINHKINKGKGESMNEALKAAKGTFFTCLDADSFIKSDALKIMLPHFDNPKVGAVLPLMKVKNPTTVLEKIQWCEYLLNMFYKKIMSTIDCVHVAPGPFSIYRKKVVEKLGGFAEKNITEDFEISLRLQKNDYKIVQLFSTEVYTLVPKSLKGVYKQRNRWYKGTMLNLFDYKRMIFNKKYGDFGVVQLPRVLISGFLAVTMLGLLLYKRVLVPTIMWFRDMSYVNFNVFYFMKEWVTNLFSNFSILNFNYMNIFLGITIMIMSGTALYLAYSFTKEKFLKYGFLTIPLYLLLYGFLAAGVWLGVFIELLFRRVQKW